MGERKEKHFRGFRSNRHKYEVRVNLKNIKELNRSQRFFFPVLFYFLQRILYVALLMRDESQVSSSTLWTRH